MNVTGEVAQKRSRLAAWFRNFPSFQLPASNFFQTVLLFALVLIAYIPALRAGFIWDDDFHITKNQALRDCHGLSRIWTDTSATPQYYPLVHTTFWIEYHLWDSNAFGFHLVNIILHGLAAVLLFRVLQFLELPGAWLASALFALHPVAVESVAWITERKNVLSTVFYLAAALAYLRGDSLRGTGQYVRRWYLYFAALIIFMAALLSKTVTCSLPAALLLVLWWKRGRLGKGDFLRLLPFFAVGLVLGLSTAWLEKHRVGAAGAEWDLSFFQRCLIAGRAVWFYAAKILWPARLTFIYPRWNVQTAVWWQWLFPIAAAAAVALLWLARRQWGRGPLVAVLFFIGTLFPALGFVNVYPMRYSFVADHFQYLACIGLIVLLAALLRRVPAVFSGSLLIMLGALSWHQSTIYHDPETLWRDTLAKNPSCWMAHHNLALILINQGRLDEAATYGGEGTRFSPEVAELWNDCGLVSVLQNHPEEAIGRFRRALQDDPNYALAHGNLGLALVGQGKFDEAITEYEEALRLEPKSPRTLNSLGFAYYSKGRIDQAIEANRLAIQMDPHFPEAYNSLAFLLNQKGQSAEAIRCLNEALRLNPNYAMAHRNLAEAVSAQGKFPEAVSHYHEALRIEPKDAETRFRLARALLQMARRDEASHELNEALRLRPDLLPAKQLLERLETPK